MTTYYIFRHGQTIFTKLHLPYFVCNRQVGILPEATPGLKQLGIYLKSITSDINLLSQFTRCRQSTQIVSRISGKKFTTDPRLNEYHRETFDNFKLRIDNFISEVSCQKYKSIIICTHGAVMAGLKHLLTEGKYLRQDISDYPPPGSLIRIRNNQVDSLLSSS